MWSGQTYYPANHFWDGAAYSPQTNSWRLFTQALLSPRNSALADWAGREMLIWGGINLQGTQNDGALYDPANDSWQPMSNAAAPTGRTNAVHVWNGSHWLVWGGISQTLPPDYAGQSIPSVLLNDGGVYTP